MTGGFLQFEGGVQLVGQFLLEAERQACPECRFLGGGAAARCGSSWKHSHPGRGQGSPQSLAEVLRQHVS